MPECYARVPCLRVMPDYHATHASSYIMLRLDVMWFDLVCTTRQASARIMQPTYNKHDTPYNIILGTNIMILGTILSLLLLLLLIIIILLLLLLSPRRSSASAREEPTRSSGREAPDQYTYLSLYLSLSISLYIYIYTYESTRTIYYIFIHLYT